MEKLRTDEFREIAELVYAPPFSPAVDNIITAANILRNKIEDRMDGITPAEVLAMRERSEEFTLLDVRSPAEREQMRIDGTVNIPLGALRGRLDEIDLQKSISQYGKTIPQVTIIKICQADYAEKILNTDAAMYVSVMMPCSISVYQKSDGNTYVSTMNTGLMGKMFGGVVAEVMGGPVTADEAEFTAFLHQ